MDFKVLKYGLRKKPIVKIINFSDLIFTKKSAQKKEQANLPTLKIQSHFSHISVTFALCRLFSCSP